MRTVEATRKPAATIDGEADVRDAYSVFREHAILRLPVIEDGRVVGMLRWTTSSSTSPRTWPTSCARSRARSSSDTKSAQRSSLGAREGRERCVRAQATA